ncbi:MAG: hypothetical protein OXU35_11825 [Acidobacteriota bacterium]|nr:hypothetical protein [Acidobacteriota bacterium]MDE3260544.1 hypothetical protein [Acidobacteriota bacterium]
MSDPGPFHDLRPVGDRGAFSVPLRKWREILFVGAMRETEDGIYVRDPSRPLPPMRQPGYFAEGRRFRAEPLADPKEGRSDPLNPRIRDRSRVLLTPVD